VHDYNRVVAGLDARERALFHDRLRALDRRVTPGASKLGWLSDRVTLDYYFKEVCGRLGGWLDGRTVGRRAPASRFGHAPYLLLLPTKGFTRPLCLLPSSQPTPTHPPTPQAHKHCRLTEQAVSEFKSGLAAIEALCRGVADGMLVDVERKRLYELPEFEEVQAVHHAKVGGLRARVFGLCGVQVEPWRWGLETRRWLQKRPQSCTLASRKPAIQFH